MTVIRNMKIGAKLTLGFTIVLLFVLGLAVYGILSMEGVGNSYQRVLDGPNARFMLVEEIDMAVTDIRHYTALAAIHAGDLEAIARFEGYVNENRDLLEELANEFIQNLADDDAMTSTARSERTTELNSLIETINGYINSKVIPIIAAARADNLTLATELIHSSLYVNEEVDYAFHDLFEDISDYLEQARENILVSRQSSIVAMIIVAAIALAIGFLVAVVITKLITKPITNIVRVIGDVSHGKLNVNVQAETKDETGMLANSVQTLLGTLRDIVDDLIKLGHEYSTVGDIEYRINAGKYENAFKEMVDGVNNIQDNTVRDVMIFLDALGELNKGHFDQKIPDLPGKKMIMPETLRSALTNVNAVNTEIIAMIDAAANRGDLGFRIESDKYEGGWREIMQGLNSVMAAVYEPLKVLDLAMTELRNGNLDFEEISGKIKVQGVNPDSANYNGQFRTTIENFEESIKTIYTYIIDITEGLAAISSGDLTTAITRDFVGDFAAIKESLNQISSSLNKTMTEISVASEQVSSGARQISTSAQELASGAQEQASSVEELNATVDIINQQTQSNAQNANQANELSNTSTTNAQVGNDAMKQTLKAMGQIKEASNNISKIIRTIQDIAFQTNLLALNAAVEAARAGEHGKGFAVVAEEVRSLAARSQEAASETTELIGTSISTVESGSEIARSTAETLDEIVENAGKVLAVVSEISSASQEQAEAISQVVTGLNQISQVVQSNSAVSEETAAASQELNSQAEMLQQLVAYFKL